MSRKSAGVSDLTRASSAFLARQRWTKPILHVVNHVSALGWLVVVLGVLAIVLGRHFGWEELVVGGSVIAGVFVLSILLTIGRSTYAITLDLADSRVTVGERALGRVEVRNVGRSWLLPAQIELPVGGGAARFTLPGMAAGATHDEVFAVPTARRAVVTVGPVWSVRGDALGLVRRQVRWTDPQELFIHPRTVSLRGVRAGLLRDLEGESTRVISEHDMSFHALREYVPGDDQRNIHWRTSARIQKLMVRQFEDTRRTHTALAISTEPTEFSSEDEFELAVTLFASIGVHTIREGLLLTVLAGQNTLRSQTPPRLLDDCAGIEFDSEPGDVVRPLAQNLARAVPDASMAILITGSTTSSTDLRASGRHIPAGVRTIFISCKPGADLGLQTIGQLSMATIGDAKDLPRLLTKLVGA